MPSAPAGAALQAIVVGHYAAIVDHYGPWVGPKVARKHLGWYLSLIDASDDMRRAIMTEVRPDVVHRLLDAAFAVNARCAA
jgi:tRNA-dihydrouridine synthase